MLKSHISKLLNNTEQCRLLEPYTREYFGISPELLILCFLVVHPSWSWTTFSPPVSYSSISSLPLSPMMYNTVDVHTSHHIYHACIKGQLMLGRTVILVSHNIQLCAEGATYIVALDKGTTAFKGGSADFRRSDIFRNLLQTKNTSVSDALQTSGALYSTSSLPQPARKSLRPAAERGTVNPPKLVVDEASSVGRIPWSVWMSYLQACGRWNYWCGFTVILLVASFSPVFENGYLRTWTDAGEAASHQPIHYLSIYAAILCIGRHCALSS